MKLFLIISSNMCETKYIEYECNDDITINNFLEDIYNRFYDDLNLKVDFKDLVNHFRFIKDGNHQKARMDFKLKNFLNNFNYNFDNVNMEFLDGTGAGFGLMGFARIVINNGDHNPPHVHIYSTKDDKEYIRIDLTTLTQMKNDAIKYEKLFNRKQRIVINHFLSENKKRFDDLFKKFNKGEIITEEYIFTIDGKRVATYINSNFIDSSSLTIGT